MIGKVGVPWSDIGELWGDRCLFTNAFPPGLPELGATPRKWGSFAVEGLADVTGRPGLQGASAVARAFRGIVLMAVRRSRSHFRPEKRAHILDALTHIKGVLGGGLAVDGAHLVICPP